MFFRKSKNTMPTWMKWLVLAFLVYIFASSQFKGSHTYDAVQKTKQDLSEKSFSFSEYKKQILPPSPPSIKVTQTEEGKGAPVVCGQEVSIAYTTFRADGRALPDAAGKDKPLTFRWGLGVAMPAIEQGVRGMLPGGKRLITAPSELSYGHKDYIREGMPDKEPVQIALELLEVKPALPSAEETPYRVVSVKPERGQGVGCGQPITIHLSMWDIEGKTLYSTRGEGGKPLTFALGKSEIAVGVDMGALHLPSGGQRLLIIPPAFQQPMHENPNALFIPFPRQQTVLVDIEALP